MSKLRKQFSEKEWKDCCLGMCSSCAISNAYIEKYGKKLAEKKIKKHKEKSC